MSSPTRIQEAPSPACAPELERSGFLPAELVAVVRDGLGGALLVVLCGKLGQHIQGLLVAARTVEQGREFLDPAVLEKPDGFGTRGGVAVVGSA